MSAGGPKNTLVTNYLYLAERVGAVVHPETTVTAVRPLAPGGYAVDAVRTGAWRARRTARTFTAGHVMLATGTWGTQQLLHRMKDRGWLPGISVRLGALTRTNSEALGGALTTLRSRARHDFTRGVAITSSIHPDDHTHIETGSLRRGIERDGAAQHADDRRRRAAAARREVGCGRWRCGRTMGDSDPRPEPGTAYRRVAPVQLRSPVVPTTAPGALRLPIAEIREPR